MNEMTNQEFVRLRMEKHDCSREEADYLWMLKTVVDIELYPYQEAALLELRRAHKDGRRPILYGRRYI